MKIIGENISETQVKYPDCKLFMHANVAQKNEMVFYSRLVLSSKILESKEK